jgi:hypothetical protein
MMTSGILELTKVDKRDGSKLSTFSEKVSGCKVDKRDGSKLSTFPEGFLRHKNVSRKVDNLEPSLLSTNDDKGSVA